MSAENIQQTEDRHRVSEMPEGVAVGKDACFPVVAPKRSSSVGTGELLQFYTNRERFPDLESHGVAFIAALLSFINTSGRNNRKYTAFPSLETLAKVSRLTVPTLRKWAKYYKSSGWLIIHKRRNGRRAASNEYDMTPAVCEINPALREVMT